MLIVLFIASVLVGPNVLLAYPIVVKTHKVNVHVQFEKLHSFNSGKQFCQSCSYYVNIVCYKLLLY